jgi:hypothetical protein
MALRSLPAVASTAQPLAARDVDRPCTRAAQAPCRRRAACASACAPQRCSARLAARSGPQAHTQRACAARAAGADAPAGSIYAEDAAEGRYFEAVVTSFHRVRNGAIVGLLCTLRCSGLPADARCVTAACTRSRRGSCGAATANACAAPRE